jgi:hypothetical protein
MYGSKLSTAGCVTGSATAAPHSEQNKQEAKYFFFSIPRELRGI